MGTSRGRVSFLIGWMDKECLRCGRWAENLFVAGRHSIPGRAGIEPGLFRSLDLCHAAIVDDQLYDAVAQALDFFPDERKPVGHLGNGLDGGMHDGKRLNCIVGEELMKDAFRGIEPGLGGRVVRHAQAVDPLNRSMN